MAKTVDDYHEVEAGVAKQMQRHPQSSKTTSRSVTHQGEKTEHGGGGRTRRRTPEAGSGNSGGGGAGGRRRNKNDAGKPKSNPPGWPDKSTDADLELRPNRTVIINGEQELWFCSNFVRTSKVRSSLEDGLGSPVFSS